MGMTGVGMDAMSMGNIPTSTNALGNLAEKLKTSAIVYGLQESGLKDWLDRRGLPLPKELTAVAPPVAAAPVAPVAPVAPPVAQPVVAAPVAPVVAPAFKENIAPPIVGQEPNVLDRKQIDDHFPVSNWEQQDTGDTVSTLLKIFLA
jgi:hypothetical protein